MLEASARAILERLGENEVVVDIGAWAQPFARANWVMDRMPYGTRGRYGVMGDGEERFDARTWIERDICDRAPYPFEDGEVDFVICSHTLEDIRDPVWVCSEMNRIAKAGYIEVPSRLEEQTYGFAGPLVGWGHHRWLIDINDGEVQFVFKNYRVRQEGNHFPEFFREALAPTERASTLWWNGSFDYYERIFNSRDELDEYLGTPVAANRSRLAEVRKQAGRGRVLRRPRLSRLVARD